LKAKPSFAFELSIDSSSIIKYFEKQLWNSITI